MQKKKKERRTNKKASVIEATDLICEECGWNQVHHCTWVSQRNFFAHASESGRKLFSFPRCFCHCRTENANCRDDWATSPSSPETQKWTVKRSTCGWCSCLPAGQVHFEFAGHRNNPLREDFQIAGWEAVGYSTNQRIWSISSVLRCPDWEISSFSRVTEEWRERGTVRRSSRWSRLAQAM